MIAPEIILIMLFFILGYLIGSVSFARLLSRLNSGESIVQNVKVPIIALKRTFYLPMKGVSATSLRYSLGSKWGITASLLDMLKVALPALIIYWINPEQPYHIIFAMGSVLGHNWPLYYRFIGGYGVSVVLGSLIVIDWRGLIISIIVSLMLYALAVKIKIGRTIASVIGLLVLIPWSWLYFHDIYYLSYAILFNCAYLLRLIPDAKELLRMMKTA